MKENDSDERPGSVYPPGQADEMPVFMPRINRILRRLIPVVCLGVLGNLAFSWYMTDRGNLFSWADISFRYLFFRW